MRQILPTLAVALLLAAPAFAQSQPGAPPAGAPAIQAPVPEVGAGRGSQPAGQPPESTVRGDVPTGTPAPAAAAAPQPRQPSNVPPTPAPFSDRGQISAEEMELQAALRGERIGGRISIPDATAATLIQPEGREWRDFHNRTLTLVGGIAVLGMVAILALFYLARGRIRIDAGPAGRTIQRFNLFERVAHWMTATSFIVLGLTGLNLTFGRYLLLPLIGPEAFTAFSLWGKIAHNFLAFPFTLGIVLLFLVWVKDNIPGRLDWAWVKAGGGFLSHGHPPAHRFNAGQKMVFWITVLGGTLVAVSGYVLIFPFTVTGMEGQQLAHTVHGILSVLMVAAMLAHIYIGSLGMQGAFDAMGSGEVDLNWAKEHHALWVDDELAKARTTVAGPTGARPLGAD
ncbi:formate dehydrogenase subunit gamma [Falsiroseomonas selenitidurans]|uniref:Formate dehydrogenase subunit gamma n=1 Tax=Falsiroseomonas selenitidurans TaxID=2716335 RepID=A0ABX1DY33_9PROT|nr:formate dehydrogenase subunit gamma [Falsiroseomonas selenitidurans]NKC29778.1 formate dehydrogenase subunit gamma [Falsiroseomonas selenitidurans]